MLDICIYILISKLEAPTTNTSTTHTYYPIFYIYGIYRFMSSKVDIYI